MATILVVSAGEASRGRFASNRLSELKRARDVCDQHCIWIHLDNVCTCQGLELADSITGDSHKQLNVPHECGFYLYRHNGITEEVFENGTDACLTSAASEDTILNPLNIGIESSRRFRPLPLYATLLAYWGRDMLLC
jgi:Pyridoxal-dependent decarboxylase conserved domain